MEEWNTWRTFLSTGSIYDYLKYKEIQNARDPEKQGAVTNGTEEKDEVPNGRTDYQRNEYW